MKNNGFIFLFLVFFPAFLFAQKIDNMASFRDMNSEAYFRFNYDNDYFAASDKNYTQGYSFELASPFLKKNPLNFLFFKPESNEFKYGLAVEHIGFTPDKYESPEIQFGDRPFAAAIMLKSFLIATDTIKKSSVVSAFSLGLIGPGAFGKEMQVYIHEATGNDIPQGWQHQIKNDVVVNYEISHEKQLVRYRNLFSLQSNATLRMGTLFTNASVGVNAVFGIINSPFSSVKNKDKFRVYLYSQPIVNAVGYDATLQGGVFNNESVYTIPSDEMERFTGQLNYGIVLQTRTLYFEYSRSNITREFKSGHSAAWGGIRIGLAF